MTITGPCDALGCKRPFVHRAWSIERLPLKAPPDMKTAIGKVEYRFCPLHMNLAFTGKSNQGAA